ncbi:LOW QUALITY PROTEIN: acyl transferase 5-like [Phalaenopsis equestris]|uniref:LOW QUALITY PROTEIN: acyl transferase 5-like n=1 Tax=Phalaenopsis equestris TaxID=78828 RepID=UPI0009E5CA57|nr:LOW QUALITY PROTEIN: acyl transferase 5-like [Phalaenopsis equestris]
MVFSVARKSSGFVTPAEPTPTEILPLSAIDRIEGLRYFVRSVHVFKSGVRAAETIKQAMSKALVTYYPLAGRFINDPNDGEVKLACGGEGVLFVEAAANYSLEDVKFLDHPLMIPQDDIFPELSQDIIEAVDIPIMMQGGFAIGLFVVHTIGDGLGFAQFLHAIGETARGLPKPSLNPIWARDLLPKPPKLQQSGPPPVIHNLRHAIGEMARGLPKLSLNPIWARDLLPKPPKLQQSGPPPVIHNLKLESTTIDFSADSIQKLKTDFFHSTGKHCSAFDASVAMIWQSRARSIGFEPDELVHICFFANIRQLLTNILPQEGGYYGNCFYPVTVTSTTGRVAESNLVDVMKIIRDAKSGLPKEFAKWVIGDYKDDPFQLSFTYNSLFVSDWTRLGFREVDYGWGKPVNVIPFAYDDFMAMAVIGTLPVPKQGARIMTQCVEKEHFEKFQHEMGKFI